MWRTECCCEDGANASVLVEYKASHMAKAEVEKFIIVEVVSALFVGCCVEGGLMKKSCYVFIGERWCSFFCRLDVVKDK